MRAASNGRENARRNNQHILIALQAHEEKIISLLTLFYKQRTDRVKHQSSRIMIKHNKHLNKQPI